MRDVAEFYDKIASEYDAHYIRAIDIAEDRLTSAILDRHIQHDTAVLDVGCGTGHTLTVSNPAYYAGLDISSEMLRRAKRQWPGRRFLNYDMDDLHSAVHRRKSFDVVTCLNEVGLYAKDYPKLVEGMCMVARKSVILSVPLPAHKGRYRLTAESPGKNYMSRSEIIEPFKRTFSKVEVTTYSSAWGDRTPKLWLDRFGVRWPWWLNPYYIIVEAMV